MGKIHSYPPMTSPDGDDVLPVDDTSASYETKSISLTKIKEWLQSLAGWITPNNLQSGTGASWAWQTWTPTLTGITLGNGTVVAKYTQIGKTVHGVFKFTFGSSGSAMSTGIFSAPVTASSIYTVEKNNIGTADYEDAAPATNVGYCRLETTTTIRPIVTRANSTYADAASVSSTVPFTWANGDILFCQFTYEAA